METALGTVMGTLNWNYYNINGTSATVIRTVMGAVMQANVPPYVVRIICYIKL